MINSWVDLELALSLWSFFELGVLISLGRSISAQPYWRSLVCACSTWVLTIPYHFLCQQANSKSSNFIDVEAIMNVWIRQAGYPLVSVKRLGGNRFELTQERFLLGLRSTNASVNASLNSKSVVVASPIPSTAVFISITVTVIRTKLILMDSPSHSITPKAVRNALF